MRNLRFTAAGMALSRVSPTAGIVAGSEGSLRAEFDLSEDYEDCNVYATFRDDSGNEWAERVVDGSCGVPAEVTGGRFWGVSLTAVREGFRLDTNEVTVRQVVRHGYAR